MDLLRERQCLVAYHLRGKLREKRRASLAKMLVAYLAFLEWRDYTTKRGVATHRASTQFDL